MGDTEEKVMTDEIGVSNKGEGRTDYIFNLGKNSVSFEEIHGGRGKKKGLGEVIRSTTRKTSPGIEKKPTFLCPRIDRTRLQR